MPRQILVAGTLLCYLVVALAMAMTDAVGAQTGPVSVTFYKDVADGGWQIKPDLVVDGPTYDVPAKGIVEWTWFVMPGNFKEDTWVTSVEAVRTRGHSPHLPRVHPPSSGHEVLHGHGTRGATR